MLRYLERALEQFMINLQRSIKVQLLLLYDCREHRLNLLIGSTVESKATRHVVYANHLLSSRSTNDFHYQQPFSCGPVEGSGAGQILKTCESTTFS